MENIRVYTQREKHAMECAVLDVLKSHGFDIPEGLDLWKLLAELNAAPPKGLRISRETNDCVA